MSGERPSVRLPSLIVPSWVSEPIGAAIPRLASSTPAIRVDDTAPSPTVRTPRRPSAGAIVGVGTLIEGEATSLVPQRHCVKESVR